MRSGREGPVDPEGFEDGLPIGADGGPPKKSRPNKESPGLVCFIETEDFGGGGRTPGVSVVLGLAGGVGASTSSPNRSTFATAIRACETG